jgi:hypothetical protein
MILECNRCEAIVDAQALHSYVDTDPDPDAPPGKWSFLKCPKCTMPFVTVQVDVGEGFETPTRVYPAKEKELGDSVPRNIREAFKEASMCIKAKAYTASAIMCRKALEGLCAAHKVKERNLSLSLKKLREKGLIEERLFEWAEALRTFGNEAAHDVNIVMNAQDAKDIIEFTEALLEYVFTYRDKFERFKSRRTPQPKVEEDENS